MLKECKTRQVDSSSEFTFGHRIVAEQSATNSSISGLKPWVKKSRLSFDKVFILYTTGKVSFSSPPQKNFFMG